MSSNINAPLFAQPEQVGDIVGFNLQNSSQATAPSSYVTFGQEFADGALQTGKSLVAQINGVTEAVQVDAKTFYADGSIQMAVLTLQQPALSDNTTVQGMLSVSAAPTIAQSAVDVLATLSSHSLMCDLSFAGGGSTQVDLVAALRAAISNGNASTWMSGPQATQLSINIPVSGSLRLAATFTAYANGTFSTNVSFNNDIAMSNSGGTVTYAASIVQDGTTAFSQPSLTQYQYQDWSTTVYGGGGAAPSVNIQHDPAYLESINAIPNYDLTNGVSASIVQNEAQSISSAGWDSALATNGVTTYMPTTGGRGDIGPTTQSNAAWLITQDPTAAAYALGQADAASAVPWNMWDPSTQTYVNTDLAANIWTDGRGGPGSYTAGLTQQVDTTNSGWTTDTAHQPDLSYYAYLMTGNQTYLNSLNAQASWSITDTWPVIRGSDQLVVGSATQVRAAAWSLREIDEASYANPASSAEGQYFTQISNANWQWLVAQIPAWTALQGQAYGQVEGSYGAQGKIAPWQQDYFASTAIQAAEHGNSDALTFLEWESNYLVGRFTQAADNFNPRDGIAYNLDVSDSNGNRYATWSQIEAATVAAGDSNGTGWSASDGDYGELALQSLAGIITLTGSTQAIQAYNFLITSGAPYTDEQSRATEIQFDIVPRLPANLTFAADGTIVNAGGSQIANGNPSATQITTTTSPPAVPAATPVTSSTSAATTSAGLVLDISEDAWQGDAQFTVTIDGQQVGGTYTATASHSAGQTQAIAIPTDLATGAHSVGITFVNDAYGGASNADRNLYVDNASYNGTPVASSNLALYSNGTQNFGVAVPAATPVTSSTSAATTSAGLVLDVSEDAWQGDAQFTVTIDGQQVGGTYTATASHSAGQTQAIAIPTDLATGAHSVGITFVNDAYGGASSADRNLYVDNASYNGTPVASSNLALYSNGTQNFGVAVPAATPVTSSTSAATTSAGLVLDVSEDAWQGDAQFTVTIDGQQVGGTYTATASHSVGQTQAIAIPTDLATGAHSVGITFVNDAYGGASSADRNLYVDNASYNGTPVASSNLALYSNGTQNFGVAVPAATPVTSSTSAATTSAGLVLDVSEDAWQGDAQFTVTIDGQQVGSTYTATASHSAGQTQAIAIPTDLATGAHSVGITFVNDAYGGASNADRNLYVDNASYNGTPVAQNTLALYSNGTQDLSLTVPGPPSLVLNVSEDAWQGDAQFNVTVDGQQVGSTYSATASHSAGQTQAVALPADLLAGTHRVGITFINDAYGGTPSTDRNLYVDNATYNGTPISGSTLSLYANGTQAFNLLVTPSHS